VTDAAKAIVAQLLNGQNPDSIGPSDVLAMAGRLPEDAVSIASRLSSLLRSDAGGGARASGTCAIRLKLMDAR
jgi:hypothetical protein